MTLYEKLQYCLTYCRDMNDASNGEILDCMSEKDFDALDKLIEKLKDA